MEGGNWLSCSESVGRAADLRAGEHEGRLAVVADSCHVGLALQQGLDRLQVPRRARHLSRPVTSRPEPEPRAPVAGRADRGAGRRRPAVRIHARLRRAPRDAP